MAVAHIGYQTNHQLWHVLAKRRSRSRTLYRHSPGRIAQSRRPSMPVASGTLRLDERLRMCCQDRRGPRSCGLRWCFHPERVPVRGALQHGTERVPCPRPCFGSLFFGTRSSRKYLGGALAEEAFLHTSHRPDKVSTPATQSTRSFTSGPVSTKSRFGPGGLGTKGGAGGNQGKSGPPPVALVR